MPDTATNATVLTAEPARATMRQRQYVVLLVIAAVVGLVVSLAAWCFLELVYQIQRELFTHLPRALGYSHGPPGWWPLPVLAIGGIIAGAAIARLPGHGGHIPAQGLATSGPQPRPIDLPGTILAAIATLGFGLVLGPEAPLIAVGSGLGILTVRLARNDAPSPVVMVMAATGSFAALSLIFASPLIAAVVMIEATGIGGARLPLVLVPGLLGAGIGALVSTGMGSFTGLSSSAYALGALQLPQLARPDVAEFLWTITLAIAVAAATQLISRIGSTTQRITWPRMLLLPLVGLIVAGLAIAFTHAAHHSVDDVLFSGQVQLPGVVAQASTWSLSALALLIAFKGLGYGLCLGTFRGGPTFPALFLGAVGGIMASHLAGFPITAAVAVGIGAGAAAMLKLPLSAMVIATLLTAKSGVGAEPLIIVGVVVSYLATLVLCAPASDRPAAETGTPESGAPVTGTQPVAAMSRG